VKRAKHCIRRQFTQARTGAASLCEAIENAALNRLSDLLATLTARGSHRRGYRGSTNVSPISRSAMRSGVLLSAASKRSIGSRKGSKLSRNVWW